MIELLRTVSLKRNGNFKDIPITLIKTITLGDIITLDRAVQMDTRSVVYFITQIDPAEIEADLEKLRKVIFNLEESLRSATSNGKQIKTIAFSTISWRRSDNDLGRSFSLSTRLRLPPKSIRKFWLRLLRRGIRPSHMLMMYILFIQIFNPCNKSMSHR